MKKKLSEKGQKILQKCLGGRSTRKLVELHNKWYIKVLYGYVYYFLNFFQVNWGMWGLPKVVCDFYIASDVICSTSSIFNLVAVSIDR